MHNVHDEMRKHPASEYRELYSVGSRLFFAADRDFRKHCRHHAGGTGSRRLSSCATCFSRASRRLRVRANTFS